MTLPIEVRLGLITETGELYHPTQDLIEVWTVAYPRLNVREELAKMAAWCACNPGRRKTLRGMPRFINSWLSRANQVNAKPAFYGRTTRERSLEEDLTDRSWAN